jgi:hypothetical protein
MTAPRPPSVSTLRQAEAATWGAKPAAPASEHFSRAEQIAEINREIALRKRVYPLWVKDGRLRQEKADRQIAQLKAAIIALEEQPRAQQPRVTAANWKPIGKGTLAPPTQSSDVGSSRSAATTARARSAGSIGRSRNGLVPMASGTLPRSSALLTLTSVDSCARRCSMRSGRSPGSGARVGSNRLSRR